MTQSRHGVVSAVLVASMIAAAILAVPVQAESVTALKVGKNVDVAGEALPDRQIVEPTIAVDPRNPAILVASAEDRNPVPPGGCSGARGCHTWPAYFRSTDGGATWSSRLLPGFPGDTSPQGLTSPLRNFADMGHESVVFDRSGNAYYSGFATNLTGSGFFILSSMRIVVAKFGNDGADYVGATVVSTFPGWFPRIAVDDTGGPHDGNVYATFIGSLGSGDGSGYVTLFTRSTDGGLTFSMAIPTPGSGFPGGMTVDPAGNLYIEAIHCTGDSALCSGGGSATILVAKSTDGGLTLDPPVVAAAIKPDPMPFPGNGFIWPFVGVSFYIAADANGVYIAWDDFGTGDADVLFSKSTDGGLSWTRPLRVNDVTKGEQFFSAIAVSDGIISVIWYDSRLGQLPNGTITNLDVFFAASRDGGLTFSRSVRVTTASFDPNRVVAGDLGFGFTPFIGDRLSIAASPTAVHAIWTDNRNACDTVDPTFGCVDQDAFTATMAP